MPAQFCRCVSKDPEFDSKLSEIYKAIKQVVSDSHESVNANANFRVISIDEKTCIPAIKEDSFLENGDKLYPGSRWHRNGTTHLTAALDVQTGRIVHSKFTPTKTRKDFKEFLEELHDMFPNENLKVILDNICTHKRLGDEWLAAHSNMTFLFTPTYCSWANPVETFFGIYQRGCLRTRQWNSVEEIHEQFKYFVKIYNQNAHPFLFHFDIEKIRAQHKQNMFNINKVLGFELNACRARKSRLSSA